MKAHHVERVPAHAGADDSKGRGVLRRTASLSAASTGCSFASPIWPILLLRRQALALNPSIRRLSQLGRRGQLLFLRLHVDKGLNLCIPLVTVRPR